MPIPVLKASVPTLFAVLVTALGAGSGCHRRSDDPITAFTLEVTGDSAHPEQIQVTVNANRRQGPAFQGLRNDPRLLEPILSICLINASQGTNESKHLPPLLANYTVEPHRLSLRPSFPLLRGELYRIRFDAGAIPGFTAGHWKVLEREYRVPTGVPLPPPKVLAIHPTATQLPANHLKFYVLFSEPMRQGQAWKHFRLKTADGREVPEPFRETELWSTDGRRLTLWFHPGRQKTGVNLNVEIGPVLMAGRRYELVISGDWKSQRGTPLGEPATKRFTAGPADHAQPDLHQWQLALPEAGSREPLHITFPEPYDWALLRDRLRIESMQGAKLSGVIEVGIGEATWTFRPETAWQPGAYRLAVDSVLEDLAGNSLEQPFEVDVTRPSPPSVPKTLYVPFSVSKAKQASR